MMKSAKQRYYAALEHEETAGRLFSQQRKEATSVGESRGEEMLYADIGARAYRAFANILDSLGDMASRTGSGKYEGVEQAVRRSLDQLTDELRIIRQKLEQQELQLNEVTAGIRRIDKFTLETFQRINAVESAQEAQADAGPGRLSKEETTERALVAARELRDKGERLTLKAVSRRAGLRYAQVVYAFGRKEELINRLEEEARAETADGQTA